MPLLAIRLIIFKIIFAVLSVVCQFRTKMNISSDEPDIATDGRIDSEGLEMLESIDWRRVIRHMHHRELQSVLPRLPSFTIHNMNS